MIISFNYIYQKILQIDPSASIVDEHAWRLRIQWLAMSSHELQGREGFLYFIDGVDGPPQQNDAKSSFACVIPASQSDSFRGIPRILVSDDCDLAELFDHAVREVDRYRNWHESVYALLVSGAPLEEILNVTYELVPRPMYIADPCWCMLARVDADMNEMSAIWHQQIQHGYLPIDVVERLNSTGEYELVRSSNRAFYVNTKAFTLNFIAKTIKHNGRFLGYLFIIDSWKDLGPCEIEVAERLGKLLATALGTHDTYLQSVDGYHENLIAAIVEQTEAESRAAMQTVLALTGWKTSGLFRLAITKYSNEELRNSMTRMRINALLCDGYDSYAITYKNTLVVIYHNSEPVVSDFMNHIEMCARTIGHQVVVSARFADFNVLPILFKDTMRSYDLIQSGQYPFDSPLVRDDQLFLHRLAHECSDVPCCYEAKLLQSYDRAHGTDFVRTLHTYLLHQGNAVSTANAMFLHRNTMRARLERIFTILENDLDDPVDRMRIFVSLNQLVLGGQDKGTAL